MKCGHCGSGITAEEKFKNWSMDQLEDMSIMAVRGQETLNVIMACLEKKN